MAVDPELLKMLVCPVCKAPVVPVGEDGLECGACHRVYPVRDDMPIMLVEEATSAE